MSADPAPRDESQPSVDDDGRESMELGGETACWLGRVCDNCGALIEGSRGVPCWRCATPWEPV